MKLSGWGKYPVVDCQLSKPRSEEELSQSVLKSNAIARGNGRAYGDSALNRTNTIDMRKFSHMLSFDPKSGQLVAESGVLLSDIIKAFLPRGWFPIVTPGTRFVSLGGMVAADVHGKNHHVDGSFGNCIDWLDVMSADGNVMRCSRTENAELFNWTIGGMGLTGVILRVALRLRSVNTGWIRQTTHVAQNLDTAIDMFEDSLDATYSVAWIDCLSSGDALGRSLVMLGEHATLSELPNKCRANLFPSVSKPKLAVPFSLPRFCLNTYSVRAFNALYYWNGKRGDATSYVNWNSYFYPLDSIMNWNRIYGRKGFAQFQCVLPLGNARTSLNDMLEEIAASGRGSFLAVLKRFGKQESRFSFPMEGYTLALDFPISNGSVSLIQKLGQMTAKGGGRIYLAKDSIMNAQSLRATDAARVAEFETMRQTSGAAERFASMQSERLKL
ncbi:FAD/FMN-containing dehydrogenase [Ruegeria halocynthiae]|uniref:FAD/FMN-containing dehydrogenase n=1 Tax=Ruegeria halocynthiae TaxID=985054 RepID=A0A1H2Y4U4_9RHOB|nr:FAD-binding oxidoreductase [Ruegeria halocynthiae]SDX00100.1 FAD/FMN-containing dehydrogenase [Ruegeria halocynthiae]